MNLTQIIIVLTLIACQKPSQINNECGSEIKVELDPGRIKKTEIQNAKYFGGVIFAEYSDDFKNSLLASYDGVDDKFDAKYRNIFQDKSCTAAFEPVQIDSHSIEFIVWTAKHCLFYQGIKNLKSYIFVENSYVEVPIKFELVDKAKTARELFRNSNDFTLLYYFGDFPTHWQAREPDRDYLNTSENNYFKAFKKDLMREEVVFGRQLCTLLNDSDAMLEYRGHKICYLYQDLNAYNAAISFDYFNEHSKKKLKQNFIEQIETRKNIKNSSFKMSETLKNWRNLKLAKVWHEHGIRLNRMFYGLLIFCKDNNMKSDSVCLELNKNLLSLKEQLISIDKIFSRLSGQNRVYRERELTELNSITDQGILMAQQLQLASEIGQTWNSFYENLISINDENLWFHANYLFKGSSTRTLSGFLTAPYASLFGKEPILFRQYGFVHFLADQNLKVRPGDSGSHLSYLGITPIAAVSTVDDDDVSGGVSRVVLPQKQSEDNSQQNNTASNSDQTNVGNKTSEKEPKIKIENLPNENIDNSDDFT
ncbi:MAG: hypothetical protein KBD78_15455, partial [Oligoflexales bacterium]|nr:hypothetical protein [Oligoflexales bacterium]